MSLANNHAVDGGFRAMLALRDSLEAAGIATAGAGEDVVRAHEPALIRCGRHDVAVLAYTSVFAHGYEARPRVPGLAVVRAQTIYAPWELNEWYPGLLPRVATIPNERDLDALRRDIADAAAKASTVIVSFHWGDHTRPYVITDHERRTAQIAIDSGADAVLGHHHHLLRGVEFYRGKPIFYGLGHFAFDLPDWDNRLKAEGYLVGADAREQRAIGHRFGDYSLSQREGYPLLPFHPDARLTVIAGLELGESGVVNTFVVPCLLGPDNRPRPLRPGTDAWDRVADYLRHCCREEDLAPISQWDVVEALGHPVIGLSVDGIRSSMGERDAFALDHQ